ncbi:hypothetical protein E2562_020602 [Oryza meyeriana var. granulata]|uniref:Pectinesterase n=1 Tax=Oryza meyeriana var. granulata TaxID=110450 RepID=A0A6G1DYB0_9ORYZ|nr:hypothetical protein E2562_020602 [Oryza meyeriana var. granulata]
MKQFLAIIALTIGIGALALMAISPQVCHAAGGNGATVARSIFVNKKGGADFISIQDAINSVPFGNDQWIRIHVAAGVYKSVILEGEGRQQTSIEWADHAGCGDSGTADSPTFASYGPDFMARDITFKRSDGAGVAALVAGDRSSFYRCGFVGVQDTLSDLLGRHYYEGCYIEGAVDFIFGEGQSIFQRCETSTVRSPVAPGFITAQGRSNGSNPSSFNLGRVVFYQTAMSAAVVSLGWDAWDYKAKE